MPYMEVNERKKKRIYASDLCCDYYVDLSTEGLASLHAKNQNLTIFFFCKKEIE
jgi:hypothetical protein